MLLGKSPSEETFCARTARHGRWLLAALRSAVHLHLGFGSFGEYVKRLFGGELVPIGAEVVAMAHCDGQHLAFYAVLATVVVTVTASGPPTAARRKSLLRCERTRSREHERTRDERLGRAGGARVSARDQSATRAGRRSAHVGARARQSIAPATRRDARYGFEIIGAASSQAAGEALASTFVALRGLGFGEGEIRRAQAGVLRSGADEDGNIERLLRATLAKLTSSRGA